MPTDDELGRPSSLTSEMADAMKVKAAWPNAGQSKSGRVWTNFKKRGQISRCLGRDWPSAAADPSVVSYWAAKEEQMQVQDKCAGDAGSAFELLDLYPETEPEFLVRAWLDCLLWSLGSDKPRFLETFTTETGIHPPRFAKNPLEAMIDQVTGYTPVVQMRAFLASYVPWFNANVWGSSAAMKTEAT